MNTAARLDVKGRRIAEDKLSLLTLVQVLSRFTACRASNATLARHLRWSLNRLEDRLERLEREDHEIERASERRLTTSGWKTLRTIYLQNRKVLADEQGALLAANWYRRRGRTVEVARDRACGQLRCTPSQLGQWLTCAEQLGYIELLQRKRDGKDVVRRIGTFPAVDLPNWDFSGKYFRPEPEAPLLDRVLGFVQARTASEPFVETMLADVAAHLQASRSWVNEAVSQLQKRGVLFRYRRGRRWFLTTDEVVAHRQAQQLDDEVATVLAVLRNGPCPTNLLLPYLNGKKWNEALRKRVGKHGVELTPVGRASIASLGPLPGEYLAQYREVRKRAKVDRDRKRRRQRREGLVPVDDFLLSDVRDGLARELFRVCQTQVPARYLPQLRENACHFAAHVAVSVMAPVLNEHIKAGGEREGIVTRIAVALARKLQAAFRPWVAKSGEGVCVATLAWRCDDEQKKRTESDVNASDAESDPWWNDLKDSGWTRTEVELFKKAGAHLPAWQVIRHIRSCPRQYGTAEDLAETIQHLEAARQDQPTT